MKQRVAVNLCRKTTALARCPVARSAAGVGTARLKPMHRLRGGRQGGDRGGFARAAYVVQLQTTLNRVTGVPMELRAALGAYDEAAAQFTVYTSAGGGVIRQRDDIAGAPRRPPDRLI
jgi:CO/xanthine dehydrogenase Mo-binding subunit